MKFDESFAYYRTGKQPESRLVGRLYSILLAIVILLYVLVPILIYQKVPVLQSSMMPTFAEEGDAAGLLLGAGFGRGDVVIFDRVEPGSKVSKRLIKRVIACPGDRIFLADRTFSDGSERECVMIETNAEDGTRQRFWLDEPYLHPDPHGTYAAAHPAGRYVSQLRTGGMTLGEGEYFVAGDHRQVSEDSFSFGPIRADAVIGRVICVYRSTGNRLFGLNWQRIEGLGEPLGYTQVKDGELAEQDIIFEEIPA